MNPYWVKFNIRPAGTVDAENEKEAMKVASEATGHTAVSAEVLPYGASPRLDAKKGWGDFCFDPEHCKGRMSCPRRYACSE